MIRRRSKGGFNVIASVLLLVSIFLVIGLGIGALSTMNLNLSGRSIRVTQANNLAEAAATQVIYYVDKKTKEIIKKKGFDLANLTYVDLELDKYYNGTRTIFESVPPYFDRNNSVDVHFVKTGPADRYYSTDNSNNPTSAMGARGMVPPFTIDLIITVKIYSFQRHYQIWLNRKWDYVISCENGPVHIVSGVNLKRPNPTFENPSKVIGEIYSGFNPLQLPYSPPVQLASYEVFKNGEAEVELLCVNNRIPTPPYTYPASMYVGGNLSRCIVTASSKKSTKIGMSTQNLLDGRGCFKYPRPENQSLCDRFIYPDNNEDKVKLSRFGAHLNSPFDHLRLINPDNIDRSHWINEKNYPGKIVRMKILKDKTKGADIPPSTSYQWTYESEGHVPQNYQTSPPELRDKYYKNKAALEEAYAESNQREVFMLLDNLTVNKSQTALNPQSWQWNNSNVYVIRDDNGTYLPIVDEGVVAGVEYLDELGQKEEGRHWEAEYNKYTVKNKRQEYITSGKCLNFDDSVLLSMSNLELSHTSIKGNNALLQVQGDLLMKEGSITSGLDIGMVVYCHNFYLGGSGVFGGLILARRSVKLGAGNNGMPILQMSGGILSRGEIGVTEEEFPYLFDAPSVVVQGSEITYDPFFMRSLNRFGRLRVACFRVLDE